MSDAAKMPGGGSPNRLLGLQDIVLYTFSEDGFIRCFEVRRYGERPILMRGYLDGPPTPEMEAKRREAVFS